MTPLIERISGTPRLEAEAIHCLLPHVLGTEPPFRVYPLIRHYCLELVEWDFEGDIAGCLVPEGDTYCVGVNRRHPMTRRRFSAAHELYHYLEHRHLMQGAAMYCTRESSQDLREREANRFAAELLMPAIWVKYYLRYWSMQVLADTFGVSKPAVARRLQELGFYRKIGR